VAVGDVKVWPQSPDELAGAGRCWEPWQLVAGVGAPLFIFGGGGPYRKTWGPLYQTLYHSYYLLDLYESICPHSRPSQLLPTYHEPLSS